MYENRDKDWTPAYYENGEYWGYPNRAAEFYLDTNLLPITPYNWKVNNNNQNESDSLVDGNPITVAKLDKAQSFSMDFIFLHDQQFYRNRYSTFTSNPEPDEEGNFISTYTEVKDLTDYLWNVKQARDPVVLTIIYPFQENLNLRVILDDYTYTQSADNASDYEFNLTFTEYHEALNQEVDVELQNTLIRHNIRALRQKKAPQTPRRTDYIEYNYETGTGKHMMTLDEMEKSIEKWLNTDKHFERLGPVYEGDIDYVFKAWWDSDDDRKGYKAPDRPKQLVAWYAEYVKAHKTW